MSSRLTLVFVCDRADQLSVLISAFEAADFHLAVAATEEDAETLLAQLRADIVVIDDSNPHLASSTAAALQRHRVDVPVLLFSTGSHPPQAFSRGFTVLQADPRDEVLSRALALFLSNSLGSDADKKAPGATRRWRANALRVGPHAAL